MSLTLQLNYIIKAHSSAGKHMHHKHSKQGSQFSWRMQIVAQILILFAVSIAHKLLS